MVASDALPVMASSVRDWEALRDPADCRRADCSRGRSAGCLESGSAAAHAIMLRVCEDLRTEPMRSIRSMRPIYRVVTHKRPYSIVNRSGARGLKREELTPLQTLHLTGEGGDRRCWVTFFYAALWHPQQYHARLWCICMRCGGRLLFKTLSEVCRRCPSPCDNGRSIISARWLPHRRGLPRACADACACARTAIAAARLPCRHRHDPLSDGLADMDDVEGAASMQEAGEAAQMHEPLLQKVRPSGRAEPWSLRPALTPRRILTTSLIASAAP
jgi:hypothetical protein